MSALDEVRDEVAAGAARLESELADHPKDCRGCQDCSGVWGKRFQLSVARLVARKLEEVFGSGTGGGGV